MSIKIESVDNKSQYIISGELTIYTVKEYKDAIFENFSIDNDIDIDLEAVDEVDISGLQLLSTIYKSLENSSAEIKITSLSNVVSDAFNISNLINVLNTENIEQ
ncbi:MAG: STAS domain-containing protein [Gammaproteobacteria bacterium]|nr:STAS domain-containing protein [Gammaproteobacteria bacterium]